MESAKGTILEEILQAKAHEVRRLRGERGRLEEEAARADPPRPFRAALGAGPNVAVVAEFKRRSPSRGWLAADADPKTVGAAYAAGGAAAVSVLTDAAFFGARPGDLPAARVASGLPVLRKDFLIDPLQVIEARAEGADAVLLIVRALSDAQLDELLGASREFHMAALVEVHNGRELERALAADAAIIGVNARDLAGFEVRPAQALELVREIPSDRIAVAESGIEAREAVEEAATAGADAVLVGRRLMEGEPEASVRSLASVRRMPRHDARPEEGPVPVKICGCRNARDVEAAARAGASYVGFVFADSPRRVEPGEVREILARCRSGPVPVGVFVDEPPERVREIVATSGVRIAQLHGQEAPEVCTVLRERGIPVWKAVRPRSEEEFRACVSRYGDAVDGLLVEGYSPRGAGGTGTAVPHGWLAGWRSHLSPPLILAGGLTPENVGEAVRAVRPALVDVSSGVERAPGDKDPDAIRRFVIATAAAVRAAERAV